MVRPLVLVILDGFGERPETEDNAVRLANAPTLRELFSKYPHGLLSASGEDVGLPNGQMGNSEVGHLCLGAGRVALMDLSRIDKAVHDDTLRSTPALVSLVRDAKARKGRLHLFALLSDGGVHSSMDHLLYVIRTFGPEVPVVVHAFLDGRDVLPRTAPGYLRDLSECLASSSGVIGTVSGRFWAMDRDNRWERIERAFSAIVRAEGARFRTAEEGFQASLLAGKTDEFVEPFVVGEYQGVDPTRDVGLHMNFRPDRARELTHALSSEAFSHFGRGTAPLSRFVCLTPYDGTLTLPVLFPKERFADLFGEVVSRANLKQFRCAETEKYAHVTYFFNGGREEPFAGEDRLLIPSPKDVATYDEKPEMAASQVAHGVCEALDKGTYDFLLVNFANPDMVGHTGVLPAAVLAVETVDRALGEICKKTFAHGGAVCLTADHGNCELMRDPVTGAPHTAHTTLPVPFLYANPKDSKKRVRPSGILADVAPTLLSLLGLPVPGAMTGRTLLV